MKIEDCEFWTIVSVPGLLLGVYLVTDRIRYDVDGIAGNDQILLRRMVDGKPSKRGIYVDTMASCKEVK